VRALIVERASVHIRCRDGYEVFPAVIREGDAGALLTETPAGRQLFFRHALVSITRHR
jgi:hypothetical protein